MKTRAYAVAGVLIAALAATTTVYAQGYPTKPIKVIVPYPPGDAPDILARLIGGKLSEQLGQPVVVENRVGASGQIGLGAVARAEPDGYTLAIGQGGTISVAPHTYKKLPFDPLKDFAPVALITTNYLAVVASPNAPFNNASELAAWAKANPGKLTVATNGTGGLPHLAFELWGTMEGFKFSHVPYKGGGQIATDLVGGQVHVGLGSYTSMVGHLQAGRVKLIGITNPTRDPLKPDLPTIAEVRPGYSVLGWFGFLAPAATPRDVVLKLNAEINRAMGLPDVVDKMKSAGLLPIIESPEYFGDLIRAEYVKYGKLVKDIALEPQ